MDISFDPARRVQTLADRGIDFADAAEAFAGQVAELEDTRHDYGERRFITAGSCVAGWWLLSGRRGMTRGASFR
jgi:hypothetical protein